MFFALSLVVLLCIYFLTRKYALTWRLLGVVSLLLIFFFFIWALKIDFRAAQQPWYESSPYKHAIAMLLMLLGMAGKYFYDAVEVRRKKKAQGNPNPKIEFDSWNFFQPFIVAFIVFGSFWQLHGNEALTLSWLVISFQNGFFWQTIIGRQEKLE